MIILLALISIAVGIAADTRYYLGIRKPGHTPPNRWSWLIFSFSSYVEVATFSSVSGDWLKVLPLATTPIACTIILFYVWKLRANKWENRLDMVIDIMSVALSLIAIVIWLCFKEELSAHVIMILAVPICYIPIWKDAFKIGAQKGEYVPWMLWSVMDASNLILNLHRLNNIAELPYVIVEFLCHMFTWFLISLRSK